MKIIIKSEKSPKLTLYLPSGPIVMNLLLKSINIDGFKLNKDVRKRIIKELKELKKLHQEVLLIDIETAKGEKVFVKI